LMGGTKSRAQGAEGCDSFDVVGGKQMGDRESGVQGEQNADTLQEVPVWRLERRGAVHEIQGMGYEGCMGWWAMSGAYVGGQAGRARRGRVRHAHIMAAAALAVCQAYGAMSSTGPGLAGGHAGKQPCLGSMRPAGCLSTRCLLLQLLLWADPC